MSSVAVIVMIVVAVAMVVIAVIIWSAKHPKTASKIATDVAAASKGLNNK